MATEEKSALLSSDNGRGPQKTATFHGEAGKDGTINCNGEMATVPHEEHHKKEPTIELGMYLTWIREELDGEGACLELPLTIAMLISFCILALLHLRQHRVYSVENAITFDIVENANFAWSHAFGHKTLADVNSIADYWSWFRLGFLPLTVQKSWAFSEGLDDAYATSWGRTHGDANFTPIEFSSADLPGTYYPYYARDFYGDKAPPLPENGDFLHHSRIITGFRLAQETAILGWEYCRAPAVVPDELLKEWLGRPCWKGKERYELHPENYMVEDWTTQPERIEWMLADRYSLDELIQQAVDMEDGCQQLVEKKRPDGCLCQSCAENRSQPMPWADESTERIDISFISYNPEYGCMSLVSVDFFVGRGGMLHEYVHIQSAFLGQFDGDFFEIVPMVFFDIMWLCLVNYVMISELREIKLQIFSSKRPWYKTVFQDYLGFWNTVDWISIVAAYYVITRFSLLLFITADVNAEFEKLVENGPSMDILKYTAKQSAFMDLVSKLTENERQYRMSFNLYPIFVMARLFKSFHNQPRLAVVTRTLQESFTDMVHFGLIFVSVYICMVVNSILLFGQDVEDFTTFDRAVNTCFRVMFGEWDWAAMTEVGRVFAGIWFWCFVLVMVVILLNFLLAIIMETYAMVKDNAASSTTLWEQMCESVRRWRQFRSGQRVRLNDIWDAYFDKIRDIHDMTGSTEIVTPSDIMAVVPNIKRGQATRTLGNAKKEMTVEEHHSFGPIEALSSLAGIEDRSRVLREQAGNVADKIKRYDCQNGTRYGVVGEDVDAEYRDPRAEVAHAVQDVVGRLQGSLNSVLDIEVVGFQSRQKGLESQHYEMIRCAQESQDLMKKLRAQTDTAMFSLQRQAMLARRKLAMDAKHHGDTGGASSVFGVEACCAMAQEGPVSRVHVGSSG